MMDFDPTPTPKKGSSIFKGEMLSRNSCRLWDYRDQWDAYCYGYKWAIEALLKEAKVGYHPTDVHYYPIIYLFRHYLEIRLKGLMKELTKILNPGHGDKVTLTHELLNLWYDCEKLLTKFIEVDGGKLGQGDIDNFSLLEGFIKEIASIDRKSDAFRYPVDKNGNPSIDGKAVGPIDMDHFSEVATWVLEYLEGLSVGIDEIYQQRCENAAEQRQYELVNSDFNPDDLNT